MVDMCVGFYDANIQTRIEMLHSLCKNVKDSLMIVKTRKTHYPVYIYENEFRCTACCWLLFSNFNDYTGLSNLWKKRYGSRVSVLSTIKKGLVCGIGSFCQKICGSGARFGKKNPKFVSFFTLVFVLAIIDQNDSNKT